MAAWLSAVWGDATARWLFFFPLVLCAAFGAGAPSVRTLLPGLARSHGVETRLPGRWALRVLAPALAGLVFWFAMAPRPTLGFPFLWVASALAGAWFFRRVDLPALVARGASAGLLLCPLLVPALLEAQDRGANLWDLVGDRVVGSRRTEVRLPPEDGTDLTTYVTDSGLELQVPRNDNRCWRAPIPCTPHPSPNLRLRRPGDLGSGFVVDGAWAPRRWPNPESNFLEEWRRRSGTP